MFSLCCQSDGITSNGAYQVSSSRGLQLLLVLIHFSQFLMIL